jgi:chromosomal replication initiation ATPase DnaA
MLDGRYRFDTFVVSASNRLAVSAAHAVARAPAAIYNPLYLHSPPGMGKTHLLAALGHAALTHRPGLRAVYVTLAALEDELRGAPPGAARPALRDQELDLVLLDEVEGIDGRPDLQEALLALIATLQARGGQIVLAGGRAPLIMAGIDPRLFARLSGGLVVDIGEPEYDTRVAILRSAAIARGLAFGAGVLEDLARATSGSVRDLKAALDRLGAEQHAAGAPPPSAAPDEYEQLLTDVHSVVTESVEPWRVQLGEIIARWSGEGYDTGLIERHLETGEAPDLAAIEADFEAAVARLRGLEAEAARLDPRLAGLAVFHDPARVKEAEGVVLRGLAAYEPPPAPHPHFTIDNFVPGLRNHRAFRAAGDVVALPGSRRNPLIIHGPSASGKTHLAHAIGNALAARERGAWTIACVNGASLCEEVLDALQEGTIARWQLRYRASDALIVDDVHLMADHPGAHDELFALFTVLHDGGRQLVFTANVPPVRLAELLPGLRAGLEHGTSVEIGAVPRAERVARFTPVPSGAEAAAPTIDVWFEEPHDEPVALANGHLLAADGQVDGFFLDPEKVVVEWPGVDGRVLEEYR